MKYYKKITGERVYLSPINIDDAEMYTQWVNDREVARYMTFDSRVITLESERKYLEKLSGEYTFAIVAADGDRLLGSCGFHNINHLSRTAEVGIMIGDAEYCGKGYGTEAMKLLVDYGFKTLNLRNIMLTVYAHNKRAFASYKKAGFREFGRRSGAEYKNGEYIDVIYMEILYET